MNDTMTSAIGEAAEIELFLIEGKIADFAITFGCINLLKKLRAGSRKKPVGGHRRRSCPTP